MLLSFISISNPSAVAFVSSRALLSKLSSAENPAKSTPESESVVLKVPPALAVAFEMLPVRLPEEDDAGGCGY